MVSEPTEAETRDVKELVGFALDMASEDEQAYGETFVDLFLKRLDSINLTIVPAGVAASDGVTVSADEWADEPVTLTAVERLGATVTIRLEPDDYTAVRQAANARGMRLTAFVRAAALRASNPATTERE